MNPEFQPQMSPMNTDEPAAEKHLRPSVPSAAKKEIESASSAGDSAHGISGVPAELAGKERFEVNPEFQPQMSPMNTDEPAAEKHLRSSVSSAAKKEPAPKISVIVPVYKVEKYLPECIESVLAQTFTDFELILVDDGSPDNSGAICDAYAARDPRIRVFHKENGGVSSARNLGLDYACGEWIAFVDSDDKISLDYLQVLFLGAQYSSECDLSYCRFQIVSETEFFGEILFDEKDFHVNTFFMESSENALRTMLMGGGCGGGPVHKLYRSAIIRERKIRFCEHVSLAEDFLFVVQFLHHVKAVCGTPRKLYAYLKRRDSATHVISEEVCRSRILAICYAEEELSDLPWTKPLIDVVRSCVKFSDIRRFHLPRKELVNVWRDLSPVGVSFIKKMILRIYPTPGWYILVPFFYLYNFYEKLRMKN